MSKQNQNQLPDEISINVTVTELRHWLRMLKRIEFLANDGGTDADEERWDIERDMAQEWEGVVLLAATEVGLDPDAGEFAWFADQDEEQMMSHEIRVTFADGTSTLAWCHEDESFQDVAVQVAEDCGLSPSEVTWVEFTGNTSEE